MFYMETWGTTKKHPYFKRRLIKRILTSRDDVNGIVEFMREDTSNDNKVTQTRISVATMKKKYKFNGYTGVHIRNDGVIRWFSDTMVFDNPIFKWEPVDIHTLYNCSRYISNAAKYGVVRKPPIVAISNTEDDTGDSTDDDGCSSLDDVNTSSAVNNESTNSAI